jgi:hypothetical protein
LSESAIIEFAPKTDPMVQQLLLTRRDVYPHYDVSNFELALNKHFRITGRETIPDTERILYSVNRR